MSGAGVRQAGSAGKVFGAALRPVFPQQNRQAR